MFLLTCLTELAQHRQSFVLMHAGCIERVGSGCLCRAMVSTTPSMGIQLHFNPFRL